MKKLLIAVLALGLSGCLFAPPPRHAPPPEPEHHPGPEPKQAEEPEPQPPKEPEVPEHSPPPEEPAPPPVPQLNIKAPAEAKPGMVVELHLDPPVGADVKVTWNGQAIMKETHANGSMLKVRVPGDAKGAEGRFNVTWKGHQYDGPVINLGK